jgi:hypothetical protein
MAAPSLEYRVLRRSWASSTPRSRISVKPLRGGGAEVEQYPSPFGPASGRFLFFGAISGRESPAE